MSCWNGALRLVEYDFVAHAFHARPDRNCEKVQHAQCGMAHLVHALPVIGSVIGEQNDGKRLPYVKPMCSQQVHLLHPRPEMVVPCLQIDGLTDDGLEGLVSDVFQHVQTLFPVNSPCGFRLWNWLLKFAAFRHYRYRKSCRPV